MFVVAFLTLSAIFTLVVRAERLSLNENSSSKISVNAVATKSSAVPAIGSQAASAHPAGIFSLTVLSKFASSLVTYWGTGQEQNALVVQGCAFLLLGFLSLKRARRNGTIRA